MNTTRDNWIPVEMRCVGENNHVTAIYSGRYCTITGAVIIITDNGETELLISDWQRKDIEAQVANLRNFEIVEIEFHSRR